jgi:hypothetical protein
MKYRLACSVESFMRLPNPLGVNWCGKEVTLIPNAEGWFSEIRIAAQAPDPALFSASVPVDPETQKGSLSIQLDGALHEELLSDLQTIESFLGYYFNLRRINWRDVWAEVICETPEEESRNQIKRWRATPEVFAIPSEYDTKRFQTVLSAAARCKDLTATLAFYRQGESDMGDMRFISAFFNFFFVLEGSYSNGKTKTRQVEHEFRRSKILRGAIEKALQQSLPKLWRQDRPDIAAMLKHINKPCDVDGIIHLLVWSRGDLHHFVSHPNILKGSPLTDDYYEALAALAGRICKIAIFDEVSARLATALA